MAVQAPQSLKYRAERPATATITEQRVIADTHAVTAQIAAPIGAPTRRVIDTLWLIAIATFAAVLVGSFLAIALSVFFVPATEGAPQMLLTIFTAVLGFLAGLFAPSPMGRGGE